MELGRDFSKVIQKMINEWQANENRMRALSEDQQRTKYTLHPGPSQRFENRMRALSEDQQRTNYTLHPGPSQKYVELFQYLYQIVKVLRSDRQAIPVNYLMAIAEGDDTRF